MDPFNQSFMDEVIAAVDKRQLRPQLTIGCRHPTQRTTDAPTPSLPADSVTSIPRPTKGQASA